MKKITYQIITLLVLVIYSVTVWLNPLVFTNLKYILISIGLLMSLYLYHIFARRKKKRIYLIHKVMMVFALLITAANIYVYANINNVLNPIQLETTQISVYVLKENASFEFNNQLELGVSNEIEPTLYENLRLHIENELEFILAPKLSDSDQTLIEKLYQKEIQAIMLDVANLGFLDEETVSNFLNNTTVIYTFEKDTEVEQREPVVEDFKSNAIVFYISGIDHEGSLGWRARSDVNQIVIVNPDTQKISLVSLPRDTYVPTTCLNNMSDKLSHAAVRGIQCSIGTIEQYLDIPINHYVRLNFTSFISIFEIIGPTEIYSHYTFSSVGYTFKKGMNSMDSQKALVFARARYELPGGDQTRGLHQQEIIKGVFKKLTSPSQIGNIQKVINSSRRFVQTDVVPATITELLDLLIANASGWEIDSYILEGTSAWKPWPNDATREYSVIVHSEEQLNQYKDLLDDLRRQE